MKNLLITLLMMICIIGNTLAQVTFQKAFGGTGDDRVYSVQQTSDGGYIIAGSTNIGGDYDIYFIKTTAEGDTLWTKTYGGAIVDEAFSVQQTTDGGYIIVGVTQSPGPGQSDVYLIKTTAIGDIMWTKKMGGTNEDLGWSVQQTTDGGYIITGWTQSFGAGYFDVYLIKTSENGNTLWTKTYGGTNFDEGKSVKQTVDGGYIIAGSTNSFNGGVYLVKTTANGDTLWTKTYGGTGSYDGYSVQQTNDGGYIITGQIENLGSGSWDIYLIKTTANGNTLWTKSFGGKGYDVGKSVSQTSDGGYIIAGLTNSFGAGGMDVYLIKTTANGDNLWTKTFGGAGNDWGNSVQQTKDGGYIIGGFTNSFGAGKEDFYLIKTDANGNTGCNQGNTLTITSDPATKQTSASTITTTPATISSTLATMIGSGGKITSLCLPTGMSELLPNSENINIYPNPVQDNVNISLQQNSKAALIRIYNICGALVREALIKKGATIISVSELTNGLYLYQIADISGNILETGKFMKK